MTLRRKTYDILKISDKRGTVSHRFDMLLIVIILLNAPVLIFDSVENIAGRLPPSSCTPTGFLAFLLSNTCCASGILPKVHGTGTLDRLSFTGGRHRVCPYMKRRRGRPALIIQTHVSACCIAGEIIG